MNVERLMTVIEILLDDYSNCKISDNVKKIDLAIRKKLETNSQDADQQLKASMANFINALSNNAVDELSRSQKKYIHEIGAAEFCGKRLSERVITLLQDNALTLSIARSELEKLISTVHRYYETLRSVYSGLKFLGVKPAKIAGEEVEISIGFPKDTKTITLDELHDELGYFNKLLGVICEATEGEACSVQMRSVGSSDFLAIMSGTLDIAYQISTVIIAANMLWMRREKLLKAKHYLQQGDVDDDSVNELLSRQEEEELIKNGVAKIADELVAETPKIDAGRKEELKNLLCNMLPKLVDKLSKDYLLEIAIGPGETNGKSKQGSKDSVDSVNKVRAKALEASKALDWFESINKSLLSLETTLNAEIDPETQIESDGE